MLARTPWVRSKAVAVRQPGLSKDRRRALVDQVTELARTADPTPFAIEGPARAGIRSALCMAGWSWALADATAAEIVATALRRVGARRPTWQEGQPEWTQPGVMALARSRCVRCAAKLPEGHHKYCSDLCARAFNGDKARRTDREAENARVAAYRAAWAARQPERSCESCGAPFRPKSPSQRFCGRTCANRSNAGMTTVRP